MLPPAEEISAAALEGMEPLVNETRYDFPAVNALTCVVSSAVESPVASPQPAPVERASEAANNPRIALCINPSFSSWTGKRDTTVPPVQLRLNVDNDFRTCIAGHVFVTRSGSGTMPQRSIDLDRRGPGKGPGVQPLDLPLDRSPTRDPVMRLVAQLYATVPSNVVTRDPVPVREDEARARGPGRSQTDQVENQLEATAIIDAVKRTLVRLGVGNALSLVIDDTVIFQDTDGKADDLPGPDHGAGRSRLRVRARLPRAEVRGRARGGRATPGDRGAGPHRHHRDEPAAVHFGRRAHPRPRARNPGRRRRRTGRG